MPKLSDQTFNTILIDISTGKIASFNISDSQKTVNPLTLKALSNSGQLLGSIVDAEIDDNFLSITKYYISKPLVKKLTSGTKSLILPAEKVISINKDHIIFNTDSKLPLSSFATSSLVRG